MYVLLFLEFIGTTELLVILLVALLVFGPRKLPELGRSLGRALHQLQAASDDFKRTWETEAREASPPRKTEALASAQDVSVAAQDAGVASATDEASAESHDAATAEAGLVGAHG